MGRKQTEATKQKIRDSWYECHPPISDETRIKMSLVRKGKKQPEAFCKKLSERTKGKKYGLGTKRTPKQRLNMSASARKGADNNLWRGGISDENQKARQVIQSKLWKQSVFARDNWKCQKCGKNGGFNAHHIKNFHNYPELRFAIDNGITLCVDCHVEFHRIYGRFNNNKEQMDSWMGV